jgi:hypothetical protein
MGKSENKAIEEIIDKVFKHESALLKIDVVCSDLEIYDCELDFQSNVYQKSSK